MYWIVSPLTEMLPALSVCLIQIGVLEQCTRHVCLCFWPRPQHEG